jgi:hypothetical protein
MFSWPSNRVKPKVKTTYTRKKILNPPYPTVQNKGLSTPVASNYDTSNEDSGILDDAVDQDIREDEPSSHSGPGIEPQDDVLIIDDGGAGESLIGSSGSLEESPMRTNTVTTQLRRERTSTDKVPSDYEPATTVSESEEPYYEVEYFMADDYRKVHLSCL